LQYQFYCFYHFDLQRKITFSTVGQIGEFDIKPNPKSGAGFGSFSKEQ